MKLRDLIGELQTSVYDTEQDIDAILRVDDTDYDIDQIEVEHNNGEITVVICGNGSD